MGNNPSGDSPNQASNDQSILEGAPSEVGAPLEEGIPIWGPSNVNEIGEECPSGVAAASILPPKCSDIVFSRRMPPDQVLLSTYVPPHERIHSPTSMVTPNLEGALEIIQRWSPFNQAEPMSNSYPNYFQVLVAARRKQYSIPFPIYMNKEAF